MPRHYWVFDLKSNNRFNNLPKAEIVKHIFVPTDLKLLMKAYEF